jgi:heat shock protein HslJ
MKRIFVIGVLAVLLACESDEDQAPAIGPLSGTYTGTFIRSSPLVKYEPASVTINFEGSRFSGYSNIARYPAICRGTYTISGSTITFADECFWTADFDWTLILSGTFSMTVTGDELVLERSYGEFDHDRYVLQKN